MTNGMTVPTLSELFRYEVIFTGRVVHVRPRAAPRDLSEFPCLDYFGTIATFSVDRAWQGLADDESVVDVENVRSTCDWNFEQGNRYMVFGYRIRGGGLVTTSICTRTSDMEHAAELLGYVEKYLGMGRCFPDESSTELKLPASGQSSGQR